MVITCKHWSECGCTSCGCCDLDLFGGRPSYGTCLKVCDKYHGPVRGRGDLIAKITKMVGIKPCSGCKDRQRKMNEKQVDRTLSKQ